MVITQIMWLLGFGIASMIVLSLVAWMAIGTMGDMKRDPNSIINQGRKTRSEESF